MIELEIKKPDEVSVCILCGDDMTILKSKIDVVCDYCGKHALASHQCGKGHYICDDCLKISVFEFVKDKCLNYFETDPIALAVDIMNSPVIKMHGPEHHFIVPAVLLTCINNAGKLEGELALMLETAEKRAKIETTFDCSYKVGTCGAAFGTGIFMSIFLNRDEMSEDAWSLSNLIIAESLRSIADNEGPRCCKRDTYLSIGAAVKFLNEKFAMDLPISEAKCTFSLRNRTCMRDECIYYNMANSLV